MKHEPIAIIGLAHLVDELAALKAQIAPLQEREQRIKDTLKATGMERIEGTEHTAVISLSERETVNTRQLRLDHPKLVEPYLSRSLVTTLKVTARKTH